jgi:hypothetical protein
MDRRLQSGGQQWTERRRGMLSELQDRGESVAAL